jgi:hypothetical protein
MTVINEMDKGGTMEYKKLKYVEFLEFMGRLAYEKYKDLAIPLYKKIEKILDYLMPVVYC